MPVGAPSHELPASPATQSDRADGASYDSRQPGPQLDPPAGDASNELGGGRETPIAGRRPIAALCCGARRWRRSPPEEEASREGRGEGGRSR